MKLLTGISEVASLRSTLSNGTRYNSIPFTKKPSVGLVPTMGYLHDGHISLIRAAAKENNVVVASIFVNPSQFAPHEDLTAYPRSIERDREMLEREGVHYLFAPTDKEIYPNGWDSETQVDVPLSKDVRESIARPGHFSGVATVLSKFFHIVSPDRAYFGQKDAIQCVVVRKMVRDLNFPMEVVVCPTLREAKFGGLAMSSRNKYLTDEEKHKAGIIYRGLSCAKDAFEQQNQRNADVLCGIVKGTIETEPLLKVEYPFNES